MPVTSSPVMLLIPYSQFTLKTHLPAYEAERRLASHVEPRRLLDWRFSKNRKFFVGQVANNQFNINRIISYRISFLPIIVGQIHDDLDTTRIEITMRLSKFFIGLMAIVMPIWIWMMYTAFQALMPPKEGGINAVILVSFLILLYGISMIFHNYEVNKARRHLEEVFQVDTANF